MKTIEIGMLAAILLAAANGCGSDKIKSGEWNDDGGLGGMAGDASVAVPGKGALVIVAEREGPEAALQYLHVMADWPDSKRLDNSAGVELGEYVTTHAMGNAVYVYNPDDGRVRRFSVDEKLAIKETGELSFAALGTSPDAENIWASDERAYLVDESAGVIVVWNPSAMEILGSTPIAEDLLTRGELPTQFQQGAAMAGRGVTAVNWRNWDTYEAHPAAALGLFDAKSMSPVLTILEDERCAPSVALSPFFDDEGNAYLVGDGALGFDILASPKPAKRPPCVLRVKAGERKFDPDFFIDLAALTGSPAFYTAHPMAGGTKLLVNLWAPSVDVASVADPKDPDWYWNYPPYFEYAIVDLKAGTSKPVAALPRAAVQFSVTLRVDDLNYVQLYEPDGKGTTLYRVAPDGAVNDVLSLGEGSDVQYLGRIEGSAP